jgi:hypothetical protein
MMIYEIIYETATAGATSTANMAIGVTAPNKSNTNRKKRSKNALDSNVSLFTGAPIPSQNFIKR